MIINHEMVTQAESTLAESEDDIDELDDVCVLVRYRLSLVNLISL